MYSLPRIRTSIWFEDPRVAVSRDPVSRGAVSQRALYSRTWQEFRSCESFILRNSVKIDMLAEEGSRSYEGNCKRLRNRFGVSVAVLAVSEKARTFSGLSADDVSRVRSDGCGRLRRPAQASPTDQVPDVPEGDLADIWPSRPHFFWCLPADNDNQPFGPTRLPQTRPSAAFPTLLPPYTTRDAKSTVCIVTCLYQVRPSRDPHKGMRSRRPPEPYSWNGTFTTW